MRKEEERLLGELIGLARATDGNEHLINSSATAVIRETLSAVCREAADLDGLAEKIRIEKQKMVPDCFVCANPCGRTSPCDLSLIPNGPVRMLKYALLEALCLFGETVEEKLLYHALVAVGIEDFEAEDLLPILHQLNAS